MKYEQMVMIFDDLIKVLKEEIAMISDNKQVNAARLLPRKESLQQQYAKALDYIMGNKEKISKKQAKELMAKQDEINSLAIKGKDILEAMIENNKNVIEDIIKNKTVNNNFVSYGRDAKTYGKQKLNITINKTI